ncbi:MAG: GGDEF domain-containing protein [Clostridiaceae bacterium]
MNLLLRIDNNIIAIIISLVFIANISSRLDRKDKKNIVFFNMFILSVLELSVETITCIINKQPYLWLIPITNILHIILFVLGPVVTYMWYVFSRVWVSEEYKWNKDIITLMPLIINMVIVLISPFLKTVFYINENNIYQRGAMFFIPVVVAYFYLLCSFIFVYVNKEKISQTEYFPLLLFGLVPEICGIIQSIFYGPLLMWSSITLSMVIAYIYLQQRMMHIDYLTGAWTREKFYIYLARLIKQNKLKKFAIVFIDLDDFKEINDSYGHKVGDEALKVVVNLIRKVLPKGGNIARYGGDEFVLILEEVGNEEVETILDKIMNAFKNYNKVPTALYKLSYSYGYQCYNPELKMSIDQYINYVDQLMYRDKNKKKSLDEINEK